MSLSNSPHGSHRFSVYEFTSVAGQMPVLSNHCKDTYATLVSGGSWFKDEVAVSVHNLKFPGSCQRETPTMTLCCLQSCY